MLPRPRGVARRSAARIDRRHARGALLLTVIVAACAGSHAGAAAPAHAASSPTAAAAADRVPPTVRLKIASKRRTALRFEGLRAAVTLNEPGSVTVIVQDARHRQVSAATTGFASVPRGGTVHVRARLTQSAKTLLRRGKKIRWRVVATGTDAVGNKRVKRMRLWIG